MGVLFTFPCKHDDKTGNYYHFTTDLKPILSSNLVWANANGQVYVVAHKDNYNLGINTNLNKSKVVVFEPGCGVQFKKCNWPTLYLVWKRGRGEFVGTFANDIKILKSSIGTLSVDGKILLALFVREAQYIPQIGDVRTFSIWRAWAMYCIWNFEVVILLALLHYCSNVLPTKWADAATLFSAAILVPVVLAWLILPTGCMVYGRKSLRMKPSKSIRDHVINLAEFVKGKFTCWTNRNARTESEPRVDAAPKRSESDTRKEQRTLNP